jgi:glucose/arabinose dehydrogenase
MSRWSRIKFACGAMAAVFTFGAASGQVSVPAGFTATQINPGFDWPVSMAFTGDGRIFVAERGGVIKVVQNGAIVSTFLNISDEVNFSLPGDRGLLAIALDPNFLTNRRVYMAYAVEKDGAAPDHGSDVGTYARLTRYDGTVASNGNIADPASRVVMIGATPGEGIVCCWRTHTVGALRFAPDGSLLFSYGESAIFGQIDAGGLTPGCFTSGGGFANPAEDLGVFRSQMLDSMNGKIMRLNPSNAQGMPNNPFFNAAAPSSARSRVWASGLRNPFRFNLRPGTGSATHPGSIYVGDVGRNDYEELSVVRNGGENLGWPCYEGFGLNTSYSTIPMTSWGCDTLNTPGNPGVVTPPLISLHHGNVLWSTPPGYLASAMIAGVFHEGNNFPSPWRGGFFHADHVSGAIRVVRTNALDQFVALFDFAGGPGAGVVDFARDPQTGDICVLTLYDGIFRIHSNIRPGDVSRDGVVNVTDLLTVISAWGPCSNLATCPADLNADGAVNVTDLLEVIGNWG